MEKTIWNGFERIDFLFEGREAIIVFPDETNRTNNWLFKTEYFYAFQDFEIEMLKRGWHLAYIQNKTRWCLDEDIDLKKRFSDYISSQYGLDKKCVPVGMSCGGLIAVKFASKYPEYIKGLYLDAPVMNFLSCPAGIGKADDSMMEEFTQATGMTIIDLINYRDNPVDKMDILIDNNISVIMVYGECDDIVPYDENGKILEEFYRKNAGEITVISKNCGHHPHGLKDNTPIIEFVEKLN